ncbi:MAG TPA: MFS transporter [Thermomicrobiales bacterium]|nr:MFS transporter [Thermomicrobiales bacterium]
MIGTESTAPAVATAAPIGSIRRFYLFTLLTRTEFTGGIWILYLKSRGLSLTEIGLSEAAFHLAPVLFELPSGSFADLVGRRWSLAIGSLLIAISTALMFIANSLPVAMLALFLNGASYSFRSGADQAYLYDSLGDRQGSFAGILGRLFGATYIVGGATLWLGAALSDISYTWPYGIAIALALAGTWLAAGLAEPPASTRGEGHSSVLHHLRAVRTVLRANPPVAAMLVYSGTFWAAGTVAFLYLQAAFSDRGLSNSTVGLIIGGALVLNALGATFAGHFEQRGRFRNQLVVLALLTGLGLAATAAGPLGIATTAYLLSNLFSGLLEPLMFTWFNRHVPSGQRATLLSVESWMFSLTMIPAFPLGGWLAETHGWGALLLVCGGAKITLTLLVAVGSRLRVA